MLFKTSSSSFTQRCFFIRPERDVEVVVVLILPSSSSSRSESLLLFDQPPRLVVLPTIAASKNDWNTESIPLHTSHRLKKYYTKILVKPGTFVIADSTKFQGSLSCVPETVMLSFMTRWILKRSRIFFLNAFVSIDLHLGD